jgi:peptidylprolyl isomerase
MQDSLHKALPVIILFAVCAALVGGLSWWIGDKNTPEAELTTDITEELETPLEPEELPTYDEAMTNNNNPVAVLETNKGTIEIELFEDTMPITAGNFKKLVNEKFYDGIKFHRVIDGFMIQGGDPITKTTEVLKYGTGGPGYAIPDEHIAGKYLTNVRGTISMANSGPNSGGSQFFINLVDNTNLDYDKQPLTSKHPVFGRVVKGMDIVDAIGQVEVNMNDLPLEDVVITKATIR